MVRCCARRAVGWRKWVWGLTATAVVLALPGWGKVLRGPAGDISLESRRFGGIEYVPLYDVAEALGLRLTWWYEARIIELEGRELRLSLMPGSRVVGGDRRTPVQMEAGVVFSRGVPYVPASFVTTTLAPYFERLRATARAGGGARLVVLDPGHGGRDQGAAGHGVVEKELTLDIARRVRAALVAKGVKVRLTRDGDVYVPLARRAEIANELGAAVFVSIHANAVNEQARTISGSETFYLSRAQTASDAATERLENSPLKDEVHSGWSALTARLKRFFLGNHFKQTRAQSIALAQRIQRRVGNVAVGDNRGIKPANLQVLRETLCPACLVEVGFLSHATDASYLRKEWYRQKVAEAIAEGIWEYLRTL
ncbi:MAG: N-acetylmuramoyl-L-alanine amidase [bacterium]|nr:N-acetylmuramoyl-L-alanine amidase [bacterium]